MPIDKVPKCYSATNCRVNIVHRPQCSVFSFCKFSYFYLLKNVLILNYKVYLSCPSPKRLKSFFHFRGKISSSSLKIVFTIPTLFCCFQRENVFSNFLTKSRGRGTSCGSRSQRTSSGRRRRTCPKPEVRFQITMVTYLI